MKVYVSTVIAPSDGYTTVDEDHMVNVPAIVSARMAAAKSPLMPLKAAPQQPAGEALQLRQQQAQRDRQMPIRMANTVAMDVVCGAGVAARWEERAGVDECAARRRQQQRRRGRRGRRRRAPGSASCGRARAPAPPRMRNALRVGEGDAQSQRRRQPWTSGQCSMAG